MSTPESHIEPIANGFPSKDLLRRYLRGELTPAEQEELDQYLTDEEGMLKDALEGLQLIEDEAQFDRALGRIQQATRMRLRERHARRRLQPKRRSRVQPKVRDILPYLISAAAAVALLIVSVFVFQEYGSGPATESSAPPLAQHQPSAAPAPEASTESPAPEANSRRARTEAETAPAATQARTPAGSSQETGAPATTPERRRADQAAEAANREAIQQQRKEIARLQEQAKAKKAEAPAPTEAPKLAGDEVASESQEEFEPEAPLAAAPEPAASPPAAAASKPADTLGQPGESLGEVEVIARRPAQEQALNSVALDEVQVAGKKSGADPYLDSLKAATRTDDKVAEAEARWKLAQYYLQRGESGKAKRQLKKLAREENVYQQRAAQLLEEL